jgi:hypothetical protein
MTTIATSANSRIDQLILQLYQHANSSQQLTQNQLLGLDPPIVLIEKLAQMSSTRSAIATCNQEFRLILDQLQSLLFYFWV